MDLLRKPYLACVFALAATAANATNAGSIDGQLVYHNDVFYHSITLEQGSSLTVWTDSFLSGRNFDPILAVWHDGALLRQNDDNPYIAPGQTYYDSGLQLYNLSPGTYLFTVTAFSNFANGTNIGDGWRYDQQTPVTLASYNLGPYLTVNWDTTSAVPEPSTWALLLGGLGVTAIALRRARSR